MAVAKEVVLYYNPVDPAYATPLKGVLVQLGIRIKRVNAEQTGQTVGYLAGIKGYEPQVGIEAPLLTEEMLVMRGFTGQRIDQLLIALRKAGVPQIALKAVVTETNCQWSFFHLYEEIKKEHLEMTGRSGDPAVN